MFLEKTKKVLGGNSKISIHTVCWLFIIKKKLPGAVRVAAMVKFFNVGKT